MDPSHTDQEAFTVDLESGRSGREDGGSVNGDDQATLCGILVNSDVDSVENFVINTKLEGTDSAEKKLVKEKRKKSNKKAPKPPRPPRGPSLDAADQKLIREIAELTMLKRIRTERIKALKKMKTAKTTSPTNTLFATIFTVLFCFVLLLQGISSRTSTHASHDVSTSSSTPEPGLISVQYVWKASATDSSIPASGSPSLVEQVSGQDPHEISKRVSR
uniref:Transmembrane protein n=1 Tax=Kalanchoe fedtschenkoi TaxID=63787 RepID=A0A7N0T6R6_KALFE